MVLWMGVWSIFFPSFSPPVLMLFVLFLRNKIWLQCPGFVLFFVFVFFWLMETRGRGPECDMLLDRRGFYT